jgi:hypothetical protein
MLAYLDFLCDALAARDGARLHHLVDGHPLARLLPTDVMAEVRRFMEGKATRHAVPLAMLRFRDQTARLLSELPRVADATVPTPAMQVAPSAPRRRRRRSTVQTELPLSA